MYVFLFDFLMCFCFPDFLIYCFFSRSCLYQIRSVIAFPWFVSCVWFFHWFPFFHVQFRLCVRTFYECFCAHVFRYVLFSSREECFFLVHTPKTSVIHMNHAPREQQLTHSTGTNCDFSVMHICFSTSHQIFKRELFLNNTLFLLVYAFELAFAQTILSIVNWVSSDWMLILMITSMIMTRDDDSNDKYDDAFFVRELVRDGNLSLHLQALTFNVIDVVEAQPQ